MSDQNTLEPMLDLYLFETAQLLEQLEQTVIGSEESGCYGATEINEIFRVMHSIKGASAMMLFDNMATLAHSLEDVFFYLREAKPEKVDCSQLSDLILSGADFIKNELEKIRNVGSSDGDASSLISAIKSFLDEMKTANLDSTKAKAESSPAGIKTEAPVSKQQYYISQDKPGRAFDKRFFSATIFFEDNCEMENIRAYTIIPTLRETAEDISYIPDNIMEDDSTAAIIRRDGFKLFFATERTYDEIYELLDKTIFLKSLELIEISEPTPGKITPVAQIVLDEPEVKIPIPKEKNIAEKRTSEKNAGVAAASNQSMISVNVAKLDMLMDLVGELVIAEALVTQNPDLKGLSLDNFTKAARQLEKITSELQDTVMSVRMLPLTATFHKMHRIVRDMSKKLGKEVRLNLVGEETEVDKNIIEHVSDPLMHLIRNSIDHGIESGEERVAAGKPAAGSITLEAKNDGSDVVIVIKDDGKGLNKDKILKRARENDLIHKPENELTDKEVFSFIFSPGFSTKDKVTEFSGRGVGMDVVTKNINSIGGAVLIDSSPGAGTTISLRIPLTLAIIDGMTIGVGNARYTIPIAVIKESFRPKEQEIIIDPDGNEMIMVRGECYPILRISRVFKVDQAVTRISEGIIIMVENENKATCLFADELIGEQQVVVKALPTYIKNIRQVEGLAGCTLLGDGGISLILDIGGLMNRKYAE
ncbi:MAG: chemotaxis protein CheA [Sporomusaceae bacterium]|nr:chemotaxis protein CheA [Sporomusaceae bacterium]